jgi:hypothetical protein
MERILTIVPWAMQLGVDRPDHMAFYVGQAEIATSIAISQTLMVKPHEVQNRGVKVMDVDFVFGGVVTVIVG